MPNISKFKTGFENKSKLTDSERFQLRFIIWLSMLPKHHETELIQLEQGSSHRYIEVNQNISNYKIVGNKRHNIGRQQLDKILDTITKYKRWLNLFEQMLSICEWLSCSFSGVKKSQFNNTVDIDLHVVDGFDEWQYGCILKQNSNKIIDTNDISFKEIDEELVDDPYYFGRNRFHLKGGKLRYLDGNLVFVIL